jgi:inosine/xanthosine triphosphatase
MKILVGSLNPSKITAVQTAFAYYFSNLEVIGFDIPSHVSVQPINQAIKQGAINRVNGLFELNKNQALTADYFVGIESGLFYLFDCWLNVDLTCIADNKAKKNIGLSPSFTLPNNVTDQMLHGIELNDIMDKLTGWKNIKHNGGAISHYSKGIMTRQEHCTQSVLMALLPFL